MSMVIRSSRLGGLCALGLGAALLAGCGGTDVREQLGLSRRAPDEFAVVTQAPLAMPPDYTLRPPTPGALPSQQGNPERAASTAIFGATLPDGPAAGAPVGVAAAQAPGGLEQQFLAAAGADKADSGIRETLNRESGSIVEKSTTFAQDVLGIHNDPTEILVNAPEEARRIRQNAANGLPASTGDTPEIKRGNPGLLQGVF